MAVRAKSDDSVSDLELFFDLVLVFAVTQVTTLMAQGEDWASVGQGMLVLSTLWFSWTAFSWLTSMVDPDEGPARLTVFAAMVSLMIASLALPHAFDDDAMIFGVSLFVMRALVVVLFAVGPGSVPGMARTLGPFHLTTGLSVLIAGLVDGPLRYVCWGAAIIASLCGPFLADRTRWPHVTPGHFSSRYGGFIIIALGESIVAAGVGIEGQHLGTELLLAAGLSVVVSGALWWTYFDVGVHVASRALSEASGDERHRLARDSYTMLHWPMVAGIVLFALGVRTTLAHVGEPLDLVPAVALCGGLALNMGGQIAFRLRNVGQLSRRRCALTLVLVGLIPVADDVDAIIALALVAAALWALIAYDLIRHPDARERLRHPA